MSTTLVAGLAHGLFIALVAGLASGLISGLALGLLGGGEAYIRHMILQWLLQRAGVVPKNYIAFLDEAAERLLLRKVGGGYIFIHRLLLDYFASLEATPASTEGATRPEPPSTTP
jgi:hypothetical protein